MEVPILLADVAALSLFTSMYKHRDRNRNLKIYNFFPSELYIAYISKQESHRTCNLTLRRVRETSITQPERERERERERKKERERDSVCVCACARACV